MLQFSTRGTFEDCYTDTPFLRRGSPLHPFYFVLLPFQAVSLRKGRCVLVGVTGVVLTQPRETEVRRAV